MSKTKEEILGQPAYSHECGSFIEVDTRQEVLNAMDAWADQKLEEYKERLLLRIKELSDAVRDRKSDNSLGYIEACSDIILNLNGL